MCKYKSSAFRPLELFVFWCIGGFWGNESACFPRNQSVQKHWKKALCTHRLQQYMLCDLFEAQPPSTAGNERSERKSEGVHWCGHWDCSAWKYFFGKFHTHEASLLSGVCWCVVLRLPFKEKFLLTKFTFRWTALMCPMRLTRCENLNSRRTKPVEKTA